MTSAQQLARRQGENCVALDYSELTVGEPIELQSVGQIRLSSSRGRIEEVDPSRRGSPHVSISRRFRPMPSTSTV